MSLVVFFLFFKQKTAYEMRISDWSSDVCSSDLAGGRIPIFYRGSVKPGERVCHIPIRLDVGIMVEIFQSGTVSGRDLKCRFSVPPKDATITVAKTCSVAVN